MQISVFQALCLLPDGEEFVYYTKYLHHSSGEIRLRRNPRILNLDEAVADIERHGVALFTRKTGVGYLVKGGLFYIKADGKKAKTFADANNIAFKPRKRNTTSASPLLGDSADTKFLPGLERHGVSFGGNR